MTLDQLRALADEFFEWPIAHNKSTVTMTSALLFTKHVLEMREMHEKHEKSLEMHEKSLGAENSAGMNALRNAAQQALEFIRAMNSHGWLLADYESDMERTVTGLEAALAQEQAESVQPMRFRVTVVDNAHPDGIPLEQWVRRDPTAALRADAERYRYLLGHARRIDVAGWSISHMEQLSPRIDAAREGS